MKGNFHAYINIADKVIERTINTSMKIHTLKYLCEGLEIFQEFQSDQAVTHWVSKFKLSRKVLSSYRFGVIAELSPNEELREFLQTYDVKHNLLDKSTIISKDEKNYTLDELELHAEEMLFDAKTIKKIPKYLNFDNKNITICKPFNPLREYLKELAGKYNGGDEISKLATYIPAHDFGDKKEKDFYQKRLSRHLKKWLVKTAAQALDYAKNDVMLLWISPDGASGKSHINQWLFSLPIFNKYRLVVRENLSHMPLHIMLEHFFIIDFDELPLESIAKYQKFKSYITTDGNRHYVAKRGYVDFIRHGNFIGSTNKANRHAIDGSFQRGFLLDDDAAFRRRILSLEIDRIDRETKNYADEINLEQLWAQAAHLAIQAHEQKNNELLKYDNNYKEFVNDNKRYINRVTNKDDAEKQLLLSLIDSTGTNISLFSSSDLKIELSKLGHNIKLSSVQIGKTLQQSRKFDHNRKGNYKGWLVSIRN